MSINFSTNVLKRRAVPVALFALLFVTLGSSALLVGEAFEERSASLAITDMRFAVVTMLDVDETVASGPDELAQIAAALETLEAGRDQAAHAIEPSQVAQLDAELQMLANHGRILLNGQTDDQMVHNMAAHQGLEDMLRTAAFDSASDAATAERGAGIAALLGALTLFGLGVRSLKARSGRQEDAAKVAIIENSAKKLKSVLDNSLNCELIVDRVGHINYRSTRFESVFGTEIDTFEALVSSFDGDQRDQLATSVLRSSPPVAELALTSELRDGAGRRREFKIRVVDHCHDPIIDGHLITMVEVTAVNHAQARLVDLASRDPLTGLPNRRALMERLEAAQTTTRALLMIDLDDFKGTNDYHGHDAGDELLCAVAGRFTALCPPQSVFRLGGDEFAVLIDGTQESELLSLGARLSDSLETPIELMVGFEEIEASVGIALQVDTNPPEALLRRADIALYAAKRDATHKVVLLSEDLERISTTQRSTSRALHDMSLDDELRLVFQPILDSFSGQVAYVEALCRWTSPTLGVVPPDLFIPIAERSGQIVEIGYWVMRRSIAQLREWQRLAPDEDFGLTVNVSPRQLVEAGFADNVLAMLRTNEVAPRRLIIEVTESALIAPGAPAVEALTRLRHAGCRVACDDFGAGYSNLGQLMALPVDLIKVDRDLLIHLTVMREALGSPDQPCAVMGAIVSIGRAMNAQIVAEGVETSVQASSLRASQVDFMQGYLFSHPVEADELLNRVNQKNAEAAGLVTLA